MPSPAMRWYADPDSARGTVLVLHGGGVRGLRRNAWWNLPVLRLVPFARAAARVGGGDLAVVLVRFTVRGWNGSEESPIGDAYAALEEVRRRRPGMPIGVIGHSMGGRVALRLAAEPDVRAVCALAPWIEKGDPLLADAETAVVIAHGDRDRMTSPAASSRMAAMLGSRGVQAEFVTLRGVGHGLLQDRTQIEQAAARWIAGAVLGSVRPWGQEPPAGPSRRGRTS